MTHDEYTESVDKGQYPTVTEVPLDPPFENQNGIIQNLILKHITSVAMIESHSGTVRANHFHKTDWHYAYVVSGLVVYLERDIGSKVIPSPMVFRPGQMFFTPPMREHAMLFPEATKIITLAKNVRSHESHEADLVRVVLIDPSDVASYIKSIL